VGRQGRVISLTVGAFLQTVLLISLGAVIGANLRYFVGQRLASMIPNFPLGTLVINISASLILGFFLVWTTERVLADPRWRLFIAVGFCATYSTYSSYAYETFDLFQKGHLSMAALNILVTNVVCFVAVVAGASLARAI
jgi:fluoride exporter